MDAITALTKTDFSSLILSVLIVLTGLKSFTTIFEWVIKKFGLETKWSRIKQEERHLLMQTAQNLNTLQKKYIKDIEHLTAAQREALADRINEKYKYYISIKGVPEDELDEFTHLHTAYKDIGGNHSGDAKYEYCLHHLPVIPVETTLITTKKT
jgi:hypothetical protein